MEGVFSLGSGRILACRKRIRFLVYPSRKNYAGFILGLDAEPAVKRLELARCLILGGSSPIDYDNNAFFCACKDGNLEMVKYLFSFKEVASYGWTKYDNAAVTSFQGHLPVLRYLSQFIKNMDTYDNALVSASKGGHLKVVKYLSLKGADLRFRAGSAALEARRNKHSSVFKYLFSLTCKDKGITFKIQRNKEAADRLARNLYIAELLKRL